MKKRRATDLNTRSDEAYAVLKSLQQTANKRDEYDAYGEVVAGKLRKLDEYTRDNVMLQIDQLLLQAKRRTSQKQYQVPPSVYITENQFSQFPQPQANYNSSLSNSASSGLEYPFSPPSSSYVETTSPVSTYIPNKFSQPPSPFIQTQLSPSQPSAQPIEYDQSSSNEHSYSSTTPPQLSSRNTEKDNCETAQNFFQSFNDCEQ